MQYAFYVINFLPEKQLSLNILCKVGVTAD